MTIKNVCEAILPADKHAMNGARKRLNSLAKPLGSLGKLENIMVQLAGAQGTTDIQIGKRGVIIFCADNGVVDQGVTQCGQEVTATVAENFTKGDTTVCIMARRADVDIIPVDIGIARTVKAKGLLQRKVRMGTRDFTKAPAMTREEAMRAIETGIQLAYEYKQRGYRLLASGEMGIGNTTTSAAIAAVLLGEEPQKVVGRGAGLSTEGLQRKIDAIEKAIALHHPDSNDPVDVLCKVGGLDLAGMVGLHLGAAACHIPVVIDGFVSSVAALLAVRICPHVRDYSLASHASAEPAGARILEELDLSPLLYADMRLGEGSGAVAMIALLDLATDIYHKMVCFDDIGIEAYRPLD